MSNLIIMTNKKEYISKMLKDDEYIENLTSKTIKSINDFKQIKPQAIKQVKDTQLIDRINKKIENEKSIKEHYKSLGYYGLPIVNVDENIKFINTSMSEPVGKEIEREFDNLLRKYIKEPSMMQLLKNKIDEDLEIDSPDNFMKELVFNFNRYEPEIRNYGKRHTSMTMFFEIKKKYTNITRQAESRNPNYLIEFDKLMISYVGTNEELEQINILIDDDKTIIGDMFRNQFIKFFRSLRN